jgi:endogenous inhibitor of DNA gyrase (YacG/DUF329 family)
MKLKCPICKKEVRLGDPDFPFCGERCRIIDLGNWSAERYRISSPADPQTSEEEIEDE